MNGATIPYPATIQCHLTTFWIYLSIFNPRIQAGLHAVYETNGNMN